MDGLEDSDSQARIARAIIDLAHSLEIEVIAETCECEKKDRELKEKGEKCHCC